MAIRIKTGACTEDVKKHEHDHCKETYTNVLHYSLHRRAPLQEGGVVIDLGGMCEIHPDSSYRTTQLSLGDDG